MAEATLEEKRQSALKKVAESVLSGNASPEEIKDALAQLEGVYSGSELTQVQAAFAAVMAAKQSSQQVTAEDPLKLAAAQAGNTAAVDITNTPGDATALAGKVDATIVPATETTPPVVDINAKLAAATTAAQETIPSSLSHAARIQGEKSNMMAGIMAP